MTAWTNVNTITNTLEPVVSGLYNLSSNTYKWGDFYNLTTVSNTVTVTGSLTVSVGAPLVANGSPGGPGQALLSTGSSVYWGSANQSVSFNANTGLVSNSTGIHVLANTGITANLTGVYAYTNTGLVSNSTGIHVLPNSGIVSSATGVSVLANSGIVSSATGVSVNSAYIGTLSANNTTYLNSEPASYYTNATNLSTGTVPTARLASGTANSTTYLRGDQTWATVAAGGSGTVTSVATGTGLTGGPITTTGTISLATLSPAPTGTYTGGISSVAVDAYGRVTSVSGGAGYVTSSGVTSITAGAGLSGGTITSTGTISLTSGVITPLTYGGSGISSVTVDTYGRVTGVGTSSYAPLASPTFTGTVTLPSTSAFNSTGLGVGTTSPAYKLDVRGTTALNDNYLLFGSAVSDPQMVTVGPSASKRGVDLYFGNSTSLLYAWKWQEDRNVVLYDNGVAIWNTGTSVSDRTFKTNIVPTLISGVEKVNQLQVIDFQWKSDSPLDDGGLTHTGFIAQDVDLVHSDAVKNIQNTYLLHKEELVPLLVKAIQEQQQQIDDLKARVTALESN